MATAALPACHERRTTRSMKTWKQGVVGHIVLPNSKILFVKCLKYPLAKFYENFDSEAQELKGELFSLFIESSIVPLIGRLALTELTKQEKAMGDSYQIKYCPGSTKIDTIEFRTSQNRDESWTTGNGTPYDLDRIQARYGAAR
jgi:hypothetical protein